MASNEGRIITEQAAHGKNIAQADRGGTATVNVNSVVVFQEAEASPVEAELLSSGLEKFDGLPVNDVPPVAGLPSGSRVPFGVNPLFVGREDELRALARLVKQGGTAAVGQIAAATGLGGIGKTQLASEFVHRYGQFFAGGVFWISFADADAIPGEVAVCGGADGMNLRSGFGNLPLDDQVGMVASQWRNGLPRLLVFDNCEDETLLQQWRPVSGGCRVLVTSRRQDWSPALGVGALSLGVLERDQSIALLRKHRPDLSENDPTIASIAEELGDLPLALHLAGNFLQRYRHADVGDPATYLASLRDTGLLAHRSLTGGDLSPTGHGQHVGRTFALSYDRLDANDRGDALALAALSRSSWFAPGEPIPRGLLCASFPQDLEDDQAEDPDAAMDAEDALRRLVGLGLIEEQEDGGLWLHRLVAAFVHAAVDDPDAARAAVERAVLDEARRLNNEGYPAPLLAWQPHLRAITEAAADRGSEHAGGLYNELGYHLRMTAAFGEAKTAFERALAIDEKTYGPDHPTVAIRVNNLGLVLRDQGDLDGAKAAFERALAIGEKTYGHDHPTVAIRVNNLGGVLRAQGDLDGAKAAYERALAIDEKTYGPDHPTVAIDVNNLGGVLRDQGDLDGAKAAFERALGIFEASLGEYHRYTQAVRQSLAELSIG